MVWTKPAKQKGEGSTFLQGDSDQIVLVRKQNHSYKPTALKNSLNTRTNTPNQELNFSSHKGLVTLAKIQWGPLMTVNVWSTAQIALNQAGFCWSAWWIIVTNLNSKLLHQGHWRSPTVLLFYDRETTTTKNFTSLYSQSTYIYGHSTFFCENRVMHLSP